MTASPFRLGVFAGATPGKWIDTWRERTRVPLELVDLVVRAQRAAITGDEVDAALVRLPIDRTDLHVIPLYEERTVVVASIDSHLTAADELDLTDLEGEIVIVPGDDVLGMPLPHGTVTPSFDAPGTTGEAIATVAAGVGVVLVPMSLARLHARRDVAAIPLRDGPDSPVGLAWIAERTTEDVERFIAIVRGRTINSSR
jgi:DNA-binding transcriptional LysR family regulator